MLPDEIFLKIFKNLWPVDLLNCQVVCHSWYSLAHVKLLEAVLLRSDRAIHQFIASLDCNPDESHLKVVKQIQIARNHGDIKQHMALDKKTVEKLFFRFPNLSYVFLDHFSLIANFDEELCREFLLRCPNLDTFHIFDEVEEPRRLASLVKVQTLLTNVRPGYQFNQSELGDPIQFVTRFPRLKIVCCDDRSIDSINKFLPVLEQLPNLYDVHLFIDVDTEENYGKKYLSTKSEEMQNLMIKRLSSITKLGLYIPYTADNTINFISEYFTGLQDFGMDCDNIDGESSVAVQDSFCKAIFNAIPFFARGDFTIQLLDLHFRCLTNYFSSVMQKMFQQVSSDPKQSKFRVLELTFRKFYDQRAIIAIKSKRSTRSRKVHVSVSEHLDLNNIALQLFNSKAHMDKVNVFILHFDERNSRNTSFNTEKYLRLVQTMPLVKHIKFELPANFVEASQEGNQPFAGSVLPQVKEVTFAVIKGRTMQSLLHSCYFAFPNLKRLNIYNSGNIWRARIGEFQFELQDYSLEKLTLDTTTVVLKMEQLFGKKKGFFVLELEIQDTSTRHLYKISHDLSHATIIHDIDLKGLRRCKDYLRVRLIVSYLEQMEIRLLKDMHKIKYTTLLEDDEYHRVNLDILHTSQ